MLLDFFNQKMTFMKPFCHANLLGFYFILFYLMLVKLEFINLGDGISTALALN